MRMHVRAHACVFVMCVGVSVSVANIANQT